MGVNLRCGGLACLVLIFQSLSSFNYAHAGPTAYTYDSLRRVTKATYPNGASISYQYDNAGNVTSVVSSGGTPPPPPANLPPVANADSFGIQKCSFSYFDVLGNDTDPDNNVPLSIVSVTGSGKVSATLVDSQTIRFESYSVLGSTTLSYKIQDSQGAQAVGTIYVTVAPAPACSGGGVISIE